MRRRTVSLEFARNSASWIVDTPLGLRWPRSYSADVRNAEPIHTPDAPRASAAATCLPVPIPPAASTGVPWPSADNPSMISGHNTIEPISPVCPPGFVTLGDHDVDAVLDMALRVFGAACKRGHRNARLVGPVDDVRRRRAEGVGDQLDRMLECHLDVRAGHRMQPAEHAFVALLIVG